MTTTVTVDTLLPLTLPDLPGCPLITVRTALIASAAEFCQRTQIWRQEVGPIQVQKGRAEYGIGAPALVEAVVWAKCDGEHLRALDGRHVNPEHWDRVGKPTGFWRVNDTRIRLFPNPDQAYELYLYIALKPARDEIEIPEWLYETWAEAIASGAVWRLARIPMKEWSNPDVAHTHRMMFERAITDARIRDYRNTPMRVKLPSFEGGRYGR